MCLEIQHSQFFNAGEIHCISHHDYLVYTSDLVPHGLIIQERSKDLSSCSELQHLENAREAT